MASARHSTNKYRWLVGAFVSLDIKEYADHGLIPDT
jgi:hypothetical protein